MTTTSNVSMYLPSFIVNIPDTKVPKLELNQLTIQLKPEFTQNGDPRTKNGYKDPPPQCTKMHAFDTWQEALLSKPKFSFAIIFWKDRCWNDKKVGYNKWRHTQHGYKDPPP